MISFLRRYRKPLFIAIIAIFLIGIFVGLGGYLFTSRDVAGAVASVGSSKIPYSRYAIRVNQYLEALRSRGTEVSDETAKEVRQGLLRDMIVDELLTAKASEFGLVVTDAELSRDIRTTPAFQREGQFNQDLYFMAVRNVFHETPEAYEAWRRKSLLALKLKQLIFHSAKLTPAELREAYAREHKGSLQDFEAKKEEFAARAQQARALDLINYYLRQLGTQVEIRSYLDARESGA